MAGRFGTLTFLFALAFLATLPCHAQEPSASPSPSEAPAGPGKPPRNKIDGPMARKIFESLPPDQQEKLRDNYQRWQQMSPEERKELREREQQRRQKMLKEIDEAIKQSGLQLDEQTRAAYAARYAEERRAIEEKVQREMEEKRRPLIQDLINRLKKEFQGKSAQPSASPASTTAPSST